MVNRSLYLLLALGFVASFSAFAQPPGPAEPELSASQRAAVNRQIATLKSAVDRHVAEGWSNSKKVAELLCRPAALPVLKKQTPGVDRVFLGTDDPHTLNLETNRRLTGSGEFRTPNGWTDFTFTCDLDPDTGKVSKFQSVASSKKP